MLEVEKGHWNNSESTHNYFQDFMKWFSIITKPKQRNKIENRNKREREGSYLASPVQPTRAGPAPVLVQHCAAQPTAVATVFNLLPVGRRACARRARARSGHLLLTRSSLEAPEGATHSPSPPAPPLSSPGPRSLLCFPPAHTTERSSPSSSP